MCCNDFEGRASRGRTKVGAGESRTIGRVATKLNEPVVLAANVKSFLTRQARYATIATINDDGSPHQIVVWFLLRNDGERGDHLVVNSRRGRRWPTNLERDARANVAVYEAEDAVTFECTAVESYDDERAQADIAEMAWRYDSAQEAEREIRRFQREERVTFILAATRVLVHGSPG